MNKLLFFLLFVIAAFIAACDSHQNESCPCKVKLLNEQNGQYGFEDTNIDTMTDISGVSGSWVQVLINPGFSPYGKKPTAQYVMGSGHTLIPKTPLTSELFSIYKNMEDLYKFDRVVGTDKYISLPMTVNYQALYNPTPETNNAFYSAAFDTITVLKYSGDGVPLGINRGIIAHEHFHMIFEHIVHMYAQTTLRTESGPYATVLDQDQMVPQNLDPNRGYNFLMLSALNEGLADFWAYIFTGQSNSLEASLIPKLVANRKIEGYVDTLPVEANFMNTFDYKRFIDESKSAPSSRHYVREQIYAFAGTYSNFLKSISDEMFSSNIKDPETKKAMGQWIKDSLLRLKAKLDAKGMTDRFSPVDFVSSFVPNNPDNKGNFVLCLKVKNFLAQYDSTSICK